MKLRNTLFLPKYKSYRFAQGEFLRGDQMEFSRKRTWMSIAVCFIISQLMKYLLKNFEPHDHIAKTFLTTKQITMNPQQRN